MTDVVLNRKASEFLAVKFGKRVCTWCRKEKSTDSGRNVKCGHAIRWKCGDCHACGVARMKELKRAVL